MSWRLSAVNSDKGVTSIETTMVFFILFLMIMFTYEFLKFQSNISLIYINEALASEKIDLALLDGKSDKLRDNFLTQLKSSSTGGWFNALSYSDIAVECYASVSTQQPDKCSNSSKIIKISYRVTRLFTNDQICSISSLPVTLAREVLAVNDYYQ